MRPTLARVALACRVLAFAGGATARAPTLADCLEGPDFVANAVRSYDDGLSRSSFLDRLQADLLAIRYVPALAT